MDYVRVWQSDEFGKMGCDPPERPTAKYIADHLDVYSKCVHCCRLWRCSRANLDASIQPKYHGVGGYKVPMAEKQAAA